MKAKYIDAEKLKAEIERRMNDLTSGSDYSARCELRGILTFINSLQQEQISLPDNLDEVANEYSITTAIKEWGEINPENEVEVFLYRALYGTGLSDGFKAGAEWMARQGESIESTVVTTQDEDTCRPYLALQNFGYMSAPIFCKEGDKVIVQIRKK